jgi:uncharacterized protein YfaP (DUF2135 family)
MHLFRFRARGLTEEHLRRWQPLSRTGVAGGFTAGVTAGAVVAIAIVASAPAPRQALALVDATQSMAGSEERLNRYLARLERDGVAPRIVRTAGFGLGVRGDSGNLLHSMETALAANPAVGSVYVFSDFACQSPEYDEDDAGGYQRLREIIKERRLRMFLGTVQDPPAEEFLNLARESGGGPLEVEGATAPGTPKTIRGTVRNASDGKALAGATVSIPHTGRQTTSAADGSYVLDNVPAGRYNLAVASGELKTTVEVTVTGCGDLTQNISLSPALQTGELRITLNWNQDGNRQPQDLDMHLIGPNPDGPGCFHVWYKEHNGERSWNAAPFAGLEVDNVEKPDNPPTETMRLSRLNSGIYSFYVNNYSHESADGIARSRATVQIFGKAGLLTQWTAPRRDGLNWMVFQMDGRTGKIAPVNEFSAAEPAPGCQPR